MVEMLAVAAIAIVVAGFSVAGVNRFGLALVSTFQTVTGSTLA